MVFYESYVYTSKRMIRKDFINLVHDANRIITRNSGSLLAIKDLGWRKASYRIDKPRVGVFWYGRMFCFAFGANPRCVKEISDLYESNAGILRHVTMKLKYKHNILTYNQHTANHVDARFE